jgi:hypothetical protein
MRIICSLNTERQLDNINRPDMTQASSSNAETAAPYYLPLADEVEVFQAAYASRLPVLL